MFKLLTTLVITFFCANMAIAEQISLTDSGQVNNLNRHYTEGLRACVKEVNRQLRPTKVKLSKTFYADKLIDQNQIVFYLNGSLDQTGVQKDLGVSCITDHRGREVVSIESIHGHFVKRDNGNGDQVVAR